MPFVWDDVDIQKQKPKYTREQMKEIFKQQENQK